MNLGHICRPIDYIHFWYFVLNPSNRFNNNEAFSNFKIILTTYEFFVKLQCLSASVHNQRTYIFMPGVIIIRMIIHKIDQIRKQGTLWWKPKFDIFYSLMRYIGKCKKWKLKMTAWPCFWSMCISIRTNYRRQQGDSNMCQNSEISGQGGDECTAYIMFNRRSDEWSDEQSDGRMTCDD